MLLKHLVYMNSLFIPNFIERWCPFMLEPIPTCPEKIQENLLSKLPHDLFVEQVAPYLEGSDLQNLSVVCKSFNRAVHDVGVWKGRVKPEPVGDWIDPEFDTQPPIEQYRIQKGGARVRPIEAYRTAASSEAVTEGQRNTAETILLLAGPSILFGAMFYAATKVAGLLPPLPTNPMRNEILLESRNFLGFETCWVQPASENGRSIIPLGLSLFSLIFNLTNQLKITRFKAAIFVVAEIQTIVTVLLASTNLVSVSPFICAIVPFLDVLIDQKREDLADEDLFLPLVNLLAFGMSLSSLQTDLNWLLPLGLSGASFALKTRRYLKFASIGSEILDPICQIANGALAAVAAFGRRASRFFSRGRLDYLLTPPKPN